jgi:hypothetical protein
MHDRVSQVQLACAGSITVAVTSGGTGVHSRSEATDKTDESLTQRGLHDVLRVRMQNLARRRKPPLQLLRLAVLVLLACTSTPRRPDAAPSTGGAARTTSLALGPSATPWPEAAARFRSDGAWVGADGAYSIDLGSRRVLWLFADTFIDPLADGSRQNGPNFFIRNSIGIQSGPDELSAHDLSHSTLSFHWGPSKQGAASSFFQDIDSAERWIWPLHGALLPDGKLLVFRMQVTRSAGGFGFAIDSWDAVAIDDPTQPPEQWQPRVVARATKTFGKLVGSSVLIHAGYLYAYAVENQAQNHAVFLVRWSIRDLLGLSAAALSKPAWFTAHGFELESELLQHGTPTALFTAGQVEFSVHYASAARQFVQIQMSGLFVSDANTQLTLRTAPNPEGPWSAPLGFFRPPEYALPNAGDLAAYAGKAHPEQRGAGTILTYVVNDVKRPTPPDTVYYPQPLQLHERSAANGGRAVAPPKSHLAQRCETPWPHAGMTLSGKFLSRN